MGIYDREYYRESTQDRWSEWFAQRGTVTLVVVTTVVFFLQMLSKPPGADIIEPPITKGGLFSVQAILNGEVWRFITPIFLHGDPIHLIFNMLVLYWFGSIIEGVYGTKEFLCFYLSAGALIKVAEFAVRFALQDRQDVPSFGASGPVTALLVLFACHFPHRRLRLWFLIPVPAWILVCVLITMDLLGLVGGRRDGVNYIAHLFGAAVGVTYFLFQVRVSNWLPTFGAVSAGRAARPRLRVGTATEAERPDHRQAESVGAQPANRSVAGVDEQLEAKLDNVLEKVARSGRESLTPEENDILMRASDIYKRRRGS